MRLSLNRPAEGLPGVVAKPPVHSFSRASIRSKVSGFATFSGSQHGCEGKPLAVSGPLQFVDTQSDG